MRKLLEAYPLSAVRRIGERGDFPALRCWACDEPQSISDVLFCFCFVFFNTGVEPQAGATELDQQAKWDGVWYKSLLRLAFFTVCKKEGGGNEVTDWRPFSEGEERNIERG